MAKKDEGSFLGGFLNNPGPVAIALVLGGLFIFRKQISEAVSGLFDPTGPIADAGAAAGQFVFNIGQDVGGAVFDAGAAAGQSVFDAGKAFGDFVGETQNQIDQQLKNFFDSQKADLDNFFLQSGQNIEDISQSAQKAAEEGGPLGGIFDLFGGLFGGQAKTPIQEFGSATVGTSSLTDKPSLPFQGPLIDPSTGFSTFLNPDQPLDLFGFAQQQGITPSQAFQLQKTSGLDFSELAKIPGFGDVLEQFPQLTASQIADLKFQTFDQGQSGFDFGTNTGSALQVAELSFGQQQQNLELAKALEEFKASFNPVFAGTSNFSNPDFPITAGEAFLGKKGTVVSPSIFNLTPEQQKDFLEGKGFL